MKKIKLTKDHYALVDNEDYHYLNRFKWHCQNNNRAYRRIQTLNHQPFLVGIEYFIVPNGSNGKVMHKNHNSLDCRKNNLEFKVTSIVAHNKRKTEIPKTSIYKGVHWSKDSQKWIAKITKNYKEFFIGGFYNERKAALAYNKKAKELYKEYAYQNKV